MPDVTVWLIGAYAVFLLAVAWGIDLLGKRSAERSASWRTGNFVYHSDNDAWKCHEDQWLWPAAFDPEKRVIRYEGQHAICGRCPSKNECSPTPGPREITKALDPWPHSETGRFHRGIAPDVGPDHRFRSGRPHRGSECPAADRRPADPVASGRCRR